MILWAVRWYLMFPVSYRDLELMLLDRGVEVDHTKSFRWIQAYAGVLEKRIRPHLRTSNGCLRPLARAKPSRVGSGSRGFSLKRLVDLPMAWPDRADPVPLRTGATGRLTAPSGRRPRVSGSACYRPRRPATQIPPAWTPTARDQRFFGRAPCGSEAVAESFFASAWSRAAELTPFCCNSLRLS
jgi:hypothetical protein